MFFLRFNPLLFSDFLHEVRTEKIQKSGEALFLRKIIVMAKMGEMGHFEAQGQHFRSY